MLVKLLPSQIHKYYVELKQIILYNLPQTKTNINEIMTQAYVGRVQFWVSISKQGIIGVVVTMVSNSLIAEGNTLTIYLVHSKDGKATRQIWHEGLDTLLDFARGQHCEQIIAITANEQLADLAERLGFAKSFYLERRL